MNRFTTARRPAASLIAAVVSGLVLAACGSGSGSDEAAPSDGGSDGAGSAVDSVAALVPAEFKNKAIVNAIYNDYPPHEFVKDGKLVGIQPDISAAIAKVMGVEIKVESVGSFDSLIPGTVSGRYNMSSADFGVTAERLEQIDFVTQFKIGTGFAVKKGSDVTIEKTTDLCGLTIGVQSGSYFIDQLKTVEAECSSAGLEKIDLKTFPNDGARTLALTNGRIQVTATGQDALGYQISSQNVPLELQPFVYEPLEQAIVLPDGSELGPAVEAAMKEIVSNGTYAEILKKWGVDDLAYSTADEVLYLTDPSQTPK